MNQEFRLLRARLPSSFLRVSNTTLISTLRRSENSRALSASRTSMRFLRRACKPTLVYPIALGEALSNSKRDSYLGARSLIQLARGFQSCGRVHLEVIRVSLQAHSTLVTDFAYGGEKCIVYRVLRVHAREHPASGSIGQMEVDDVVFQQRQNGRVFSLASQVKEIHNDVNLRMMDLSG
jgi:hypothetical protein